MAQERTLAGVPDTTYIPLVARIYVSKRFPDYFRDDQALALESQIPGEAIQTNSGEYECMASVARSHVFDSKLSAFLAQHPTGNVAFLGGGLETNWSRVGVPTARCYQVDLPEVLDVRRRALSQAANEELIAGDMLAMEWAKRMDTSLPTLLVVSGVWQKGASKQCPDGFTAKFERAGMVPHHCPSTRDASAGCHICPRRREGHLGQTQREGP